MTTRRVAIATSLIALALPLAQSAPAPAAPLPRLAGATTITGTATASTLVRLDRAIQVPADELHDRVEVNGRGRAYGIVLAGAERRTRDAFLSVINFSFCGRSCTSERDGAAYGFFNNDVESGLIELPAGLYQVAIIADGSKVAAKLSLPGLSGSTVIRPASRTSGPSSEKVVVSGDDSKAIYSGGSTFRVQDRVFSASALRVKRSLATGGVFGACFYEDGLPSAGAFAPGCPGGANNLFLDAVVGPVPTEYVFASALVFSEQGPAGHGNWFGGGAIEDADAVSVQVPLDL